MNPLGRPKKIATSEDLTMARLRGESEGRLLARNEERRLIAEWLKHQAGTPRDLAYRISCGEHTRG